MSTGHPARRPWRGDTVWDLLLPFSGGVGAGVLVMVFAQGDLVSFVAGFTLAAVHAVLLVRLLVRGVRSEDVELQRHLSTPLALTISLVVSARLLPAYVYSLALFWVVFAALFNFLRFRSERLNAFLIVYLGVATLVGFMVHPVPRFAAASLAFLSFATAYVLAYQRRVLHTLAADLSLTEARARHAATSDPATGLPNRSAFLTFLAEPSVPPGQAVLVAAFDVEDIAVVRSRLDGADAAILATAADRLLAEAGGWSADVRLIGISGGDRLLLVEPAVGDPTTRVLRLVDRLAAPFGPRTPPVQAHITSGYVLGERGVDAAGLVLAAEEALAEARADGGARARAFDPARRELRVRANTLGADLSRGLAAGELRLHYQLQVDRRGRAVAAEGLMRWHHPRRGLVPPAEFILALETSGLIGRAGAGALGEAVALSRELRAAGFPTWRTAVNLSPHQLLDPDLPGQVERLLVTTGLDGSGLEIELTEGVLLQSTTAAQERLQAIRRLGVECSVDDFGVGYSSLARLIELPLDAVKVDKCFVDRIGMSTEGEGLVRAILTMAVALGKRTVAEGVETREQFDFLVAAGCDQFQGYHFARPAPRDELLARLAHERAGG